MLEIGGNFERGMVKGKGYKKWRATNANSHTGQYFIYRGSLENS